ncbi:ABC transporter G family protein [Cavenderia fasciculata]|uniref:ABC transporter G family protein n=1 Tax=Cavenderia fasciculata TaxID=261658 RepID=F4QFA7_CACFS|nr:ABC transporter G family protein [Cavenderia fasciculata]EGG13414.1 ABC transporter G family protein [Cavenderia fasciculata]|eukprot:XP_004350118.1 ABC transporter G family protein [Cavenderia fasciculata]
MIVVCVIDISSLAEYHQSRQDEDTNHRNPICGSASYFIPTCKFVDSTPFITKSSSDDYPWSGESCNGTTFTFNNTSSQCGLQDCYSAWDQGTCIDHLCICNPLYHGPNCEYNLNPYHDWDLMDCHGGRFCPPVYGAPGLPPRQCYCPPGAAGIECNVCTDDSFCQTSSSSSSSSSDSTKSSCDQSIFIDRHKVYSCNVTSPEINGDLQNSNASTTFECDFPTGDYTGEGVCNMNLYFRLTGDPLYFNCNFTNCTSDILPNGQEQQQQQYIYCSQSTCNCTSYCGSLFNGLISQVTGYAKFICDSDYSCVFSQETLLYAFPPIPLQCIAGGCNNQ